VLLDPAPHVTGRQVAGAGHALVVGVLDAEQALVATLRAQVDDAAQQPGAVGERAGREGLLRAREHRLERRRGSVLEVGGRNQAMDERL